MTGKGGAPMIRLFRCRLARRALAAAAGGLVLAAGCSATSSSLPRASPQPGSQPAVPSPGSGQPSPGESTISVRTASPSSASPVSAPAGSPGPAANSPAPLPACSTTDLHAGVGEPDGAAGSIYYPVQFTNASAASCGMFGYPGVSFVASPGGARIGGAATRNPTVAAQLVILAPGDTAHADLQVAVAGVYPPQECKPVTAHWLQIYPPGQIQPLYASFAASTCTGPVPGGSTLGIYVVQPGATGP